MSKGLYEVKVGLAEMLKGGVIMDVTDAKQAKIAEDAGAVAVMASVTSMITPPFSISARPTFTS
jgi:pyridoxal biosynthesis lyase PdxS